MSEHELREGLALAVADEPPLALNLDSLVSTAERMVRRRRALVAVGTATALVAVAAVTVPVVLGIAPGAPAELPVAAPPPPVSSTTPTATPPKRPTPSVAALRERAEQMRAYLREQFPKVVPNATDVDVRPFGGEAEGDFFPDQRYVTGTVEYTVNGQRTAIILQINMDPVQPNDDCTACQVVPQKDGSRITIVPMGKSGEPNGMDIITAQHDRTDRSVVTVTTYGYDPTGKGGTGARPQLTVDQVAKLAADPNLRI
ncbi:hypothetical protein GCM10029964_119690 [Kibdelosporangium lantanae]